MLKLIRVGEVESSETNPMSFHILLVVLKQEYNDF